MKIVLTNTIVKKYQEVAKTNEFHLNFSSQYVQAEHMDYVTSNVPPGPNINFFLLSLQVRQRKKIMSCTQTPLQLAELRGETFFVGAYKKYD